MSNTTELVLGGKSTFQTAIGELKATAAQVGTLEGPITSIQTIVQDVDTLLTDVVDLLNFATEVDEIIEVMGEALNFLDPIPFVGEVAAAMAEVIETVAEVFQEALDALEELKSSVISPIQKVLKDMEIGLKDIRAVVVEISQKVPGYVNTVSVLNFLSEIAAPIASILENAHAPDGAATRLTKLITEFGEIGQDVSKAIGDLTPALTVIDDAVKVLVKLFDDITGQGAGTQASDQKQSSSTGHGNAQSTGDGFSRLQNAIKPVAWVLDAVFCLLEKILKPIVDAILDATGLRKVVDDATNAIFSKLGASPNNQALSQIAGKTKSDSNTDGISSNGANVGTDKGAATQHLWAATLSALGDYRNGDSGRKEAVYALISAITGTKVDSNSPIQPPDWPPNPKFTSAPGVTGTQAQLAAQATEHHMVLARVQRTLDARTAAPAKLPMTKSFLTTPQFKALDLPSINASQFPNCAKLVASVGGMITDIETLAENGVTFQKAMVDLGSALSLPTTFNEQTTLLAAIFKDASDILTFLESLNVTFVNELVDPIEEVIKTQSADVALLVSAVPGLVKAVAAMETASQPVIAALPQMPLLEKTIRDLDGWVLSVHQITQLIRNANATNKTKGGDQAKAIADFTAAVEKSAGALYTRIEAISTETESISGAIKAMTDGISVYTGQLKTVSGHSQLLSGKALPYAQQAAHILGIVDSIVEPLQGLLQDLNCVDSTNLVKFSGKMAFDSMKTVAVAAANPPDGTFATLADNLAAKVIPLDQMASDVTTAASDINSKTVAAFQGSSGALATGLQNLDQHLKETQTYTTETPTRDGTYVKVEKVDGKYTVTKVKAATVTQTVGNDLIDGDLMKQAKAIMAALNVQKKQTA